MSYQSICHNREFHVVVIGAGFSGLCMGMKLKALGIPFTILDKAAEVGGTWWYNTYPGCACDVPSHLYSFSFERNGAWSRVYPSQPEILDYLKNCAKKHNLYPHIKLNTTVVSGSWDASTSKWIIKTKEGETYTGNILVSGAGGIHVPNRPNLEDFDKFQGTSFHSAEWDHSWSAENKSVAVIGSAASAVQIVPELQKTAKNLYVFQRSPNWIMPRRNGLYPKWMLVLLQIPILSFVLRFLYYLRQELSFYLFFDPERRSAKWGQKFLVSFMQQTVKSPDLVQTLTPSYPVGCKRLLVSSNYYPALVQENVKVVTSPIQGFSKTGIIVNTTTSTEDHSKASQSSIDVDCVIFATGYKIMSGYPQLTGRTNRDLVADVWGDAPAAYLGICVPEFPNMFLLLGPNTGLGHNSMVWMIECQVNYTIQCLRRMLDRNLNSLEVTQSAFESYQKSIRSKMGQTVWTRANCNSWYQNEHGDVYALWPGHTFSYWWATRAPAFGHYATN